MKVTCSHIYLKEAAILSEKIAGKNPTLPVLNSVLISAEGKSLIFLSTNLEMALDIKIPCKVEKEGKTAVPAKLFASFISSLSPEENIKLETRNENLALATSNSSTTINGYRVDDFPVFPKVKEKMSFLIPVKDFITGLKSVYYATSLSEMKPELNSIFVYSSKNTPLTFAATDSFRLAEKNIPYNFSDSPSFLIPYRSAVEILRIFENRDGDLKIFLDDNYIILECDRIKFTSRLTEGIFPDYKQIIPAKFVSAVTVDKKRFVDDLRTSSMFCGKLNEIKIRIYKGESFLEIQTNNPDLGEHVVSVPAKVEGEDLVMVFNYKYLADCFALIESDKISLRFSGEGRPLLISAPDKADFRYLAMPMKDF